MQTYTGEQQRRKIKGLQFASIRVCTPALL
jgi:hypothetical protein